MKSRFAFVDPLVKTDFLEEPPYPQKTHRQGNDRY
jgi:hypothetical protein